MKAIGVKQAALFENQESFVSFETGEPELLPHDILVKVEAISVNPVDKWIRKSIQGTLESPKILGWDGVGTVVKLGEKSELFEVGDRVFWAGDVTRSGSNSEFQAVDERIVGFAPENLTDAQAAAMPLTSLTAYEALFERMHIQADDAGKSILIISGAGGVGSIATQMAKKIAQLNVISTASSDEACAWVKKMGADFVVDHHQDLIKQVRALGLQYVDYILILNAVDAHIHEAVELIAPQGYIADIVEPSQPLPLAKLAHKSATFAFEWMYTKAVSDTENIKTQHDILNQVAEWLDNETLESTMTQNFGTITAENLSKAHQAIESNHTIGKIVLAN